MQQNVQIINAVPIKQFIQDGLNNPDRMKAFGHDAIEILAEIEYAPKLEVEPVRHGVWERVQMWATKAKFKCSLCGREIMSRREVNMTKYPYCHCGAKMSSGDKNE